MAKTKATTETSATSDSDEKIVENFLKNGKLNRVLKGLDFNQLHALKLTVDKTLKSKLEDEKARLADLEKSLGL